jgi:hypothetical protein
MALSPRTFRVVRLVAAGLSIVGASFTTRTAHAQSQIRDPGDHPHYSVDLEPHLVVEWDDTESDTNYTDSEEFGLGLRASIPVIDNGPVRSINNNLAVGFGLDWAHFSGDCGGPFFRGQPIGFNCSADHFLVPVVAQWNFFFTPVVGAFAELGFAFEHASTHASCDTGIVDIDCEETHSDNNVIPVFAIGPRFTLSNSFAITIRVGYPYLSVGGSFLL